MPTLVLKLSVHRNPTVSLGKSKIPPRADSVREPMFSEQCCRGSHIPNTPPPSGSVQIHGGKLMRKRVGAPWRTAARRGAPRGAPPARPSPDPRAMEPEKDAAARRGAPRPAGGAPRPSPDPRTAGAKKSAPLLVQIYARPGQKQIRGGSTSPNVHSAEPCPWG